MMYVQENKLRQHQNEKSVIVKAQMALVVRD